MNEGGLLADPLVQSALLPLGVALVVCGLIRMIGGPGRGALLAGFGVGLSFLAAYLSIIGVPPFPPTGSSQKLFYVAALATAAGFGLDLAGASRRIALALAVVVVGGGVVWLALPRLGGFPFSAETLSLVAVLAALTVVLFRLERGAGKDTSAPVMLLAVLIGLGALAMIGASASIAQLAFAMAAALGGFLLWNWPKPRFAFDHALLLGGTAVTVALATQMVFFTRAPVAPLVLLLAVFFADLAAARIKLRPGRLGEALGPVILGLICLIPVSLAVGIAYLLADDPNPYG